MEVLSFVKEREFCQKNKHGHRPYHGLLKQFQRKPRPMWWIFFRGTAYFRGTKYHIGSGGQVHQIFPLIGTSHPYTTKQIAKLCIDHVCKLHEIHVVVITDKDRIFTSALWLELVKYVDVKMNFSTSYQPQTNGQTERINLYLMGYLRCMASPMEGSHWLSLA